MPSEIEICNLALVAIGDTTITSLDEATKRANVCKLWYPISRDATLRAHPWNFAEKRASLVRIAGETPVMDFSYLFQLPADCLKVRRLSDAQYDVPYRIEGDRLLCDDPTASILYTFREINPQAYDGLFVEAFVYRLASNIAYPIRQDLNLADAMLKISQMKLSEAKGVDAQEGTPEQIVADDLSRVR